MENRRQVDIGLASLEQKVDDWFRETNNMLSLMMSNEEKCKSHINGNIKEVETRVKAIEELVISVRNPVKAIGWAFVIVMGVMMTAFAHKILSVFGK